MVVEEHRTLLKKAACHTESVESCCWLHPILSAGTVRSSAYILYMHLNHTIYIYIALCSIEGMRFYKVCQSCYFSFLDLKDSVLCSTATWGQFPPASKGDLVVSGVHQAKWAVPRGNVSFFHMLSSFLYFSTQASQRLSFQSNFWRHVPFFSAIFCKH